MEDPIIVKRTELERLLQAEPPDEAALFQYFEIDESNPFAQDLKLRDNVEVVTDSEVVEKGLFSDALLNLLNWKSRKNRRKKFDTFKKLHPEVGIMVSEGDSWFQHPLVFDTIDHLLRWFPVYSIGAGGDTLRNMHRKPKSLLRALKKEEPVLLLISAGGNDILGDPQFAGFLHPYSNGPAPGEKPERFLNQRFHDELQTLGSLLADLNTTIHHRFPRVQVVMHGYDYIIPNNPNVPKKLYQSQDKSWLGKPMEDRGIVDPADKQAIIRYILDRYNDILADMDRQMPHFHYVDLRHTVKPHQWHDEIHPNADGYMDVSLKIKAKIQEVIH